VKIYPGHRILAGGGGGGGFFRRPLIGGCIFQGKRDPVQLPRALVGGGVNRFVLAYVMDALAKHFRSDEGEPFWVT